MWWNKLSKKKARISRVGQAAALTLVLLSAGCGSEGPSPEAISEVAQAAAGGELTPDMMLELANSLGALSGGLSGDEPRGPSLDTQIQDALDIAQQVLNSEEGESLPFASNLREVVKILSESGGYMTESETEELTSQIGSILNGMGSGGSRPGPPIPGPGPGGPRPGGPGPGGPGPF